MKKPDDIEVFEDPLSALWIDKDGILNVLTKPVARTLENTKELVQQIKKLLGGKKAYVISDLTPIGEITEEAREYYKKEFPGIFKAIAMVAGSELGRMVGVVVNLIFNPAIPTKIFNSEAEARAWLKELQASGEPIIPPKTAGRKIEGTLLLVDDDPNEEIFMKYALKDGHWNVSVKFFLTADKALEYLKETTDEIFLIISDINMPRMNGFEFKKAIDADKELSKKSIPFLFASNSALMDDIVKAYDNKVQGYFKKPADISESSEMLNSIFNYWLVSRHPHKINF